MKTLCFLIFTVFLALAVAEDSSNQGIQASGTKIINKSAKVSKSTKAYNIAKEECLKKSNELKGKKLTDCIVEYQKEAK